MAGDDAIPVYCSQVSSAKAATSALPQISQVLFYNLIGCVVRLANRTRQILDAQFNLSYPLGRHLFSQVYKSTQHTLQHFAHNNSKILIKSCVGLGSTRNERY